MSALASPGRRVRAWGVLAGLSGASAVAIAAWASHGLAASVEPDALARAVQQAGSATQQHLIHSLALLAVAVWARLHPGAWLHVAGVLFTVGILLFSFGIYVLHLWWPSLGGGGLRYLVPIGGMAFILGWLALAIAAAGTTRAPG